MSEDLDNLQQMLEQATAAEGEPEGDLDGQAASLREAWLAFGQLLEAAQPPLETFPLPLTGEQQGGKATPPVRPHRWLVPIGGLLAASLLVGIATTWTLRTTNRSENSHTVPVQTASAQAHKRPQPAATSNGPEWNDSFDEQIAQLGQQLAYARDGQSGQPDAFGLVQYRIDQFRQEMQADTF
jgi:hypothetical protein